MSPTATGFTVRGRTLHRALIIEDDVSLRMSLCRSIRRRGMDATTAASLAEARLLLKKETFDLAVVDVFLLDGSSLEVIEELLALRPAPIVVSMSGKASGATGFALAQMGVRVFVDKPVSEAELWGAIENAPDDKDLLAERVVGKEALPETERAVRRSILEVALARTGGNKSHVARLLGISRPCVHKLLKSRKDD